MSTPDLNFIQALQGVFGPNCARFDSDLRARLRRLYDRAHAEGVLDALEGERPLAKVGETVEQFLSLDEGVFIQNGHLEGQGQMRKILQAGEVSATNCIAVLVNATTGAPVGEPEAWDTKQFQQYSPYKAVAPPGHQKKSA